MKLSLHGVSVWYSNAVTQLRIAREAGFTGWNYCLNIYFVIWKMVAAMQNIVS